MFVCASWGCPLRLNSKLLPGESKLLRAQAIVLGFRVYAFDAAPRTARWRRFSRMCAICTTRYVRPPQQVCEVRIG